MDTMITYNENPYLTWWRHDCNEYSIQNKDVSGRTLNILLEGSDGWSLQFNVLFLHTVSFTLPGDGVFDITVSALPLEKGLNVQVFEDILVEICQLQWCFLKLLGQLYCSDCATGSSLAGVLVGDPCKELCKEKGLTAGQGGVQADYTALRLAIVQLKAMMFVYFSHIYAYHLEYTSLSVPPEVRAQQQAIIKKLWGQLLAFTKSCGFDCIKGAEGANKNCKGC